MLENLITSKTKRKLLSLFLLNPEREFYLREIARLTGEQPNAVIGELKKLDKLGLIKAERRGNSVFYKADKMSPIYDELKRIVLKTDGLGEELAKFIRKTHGVEFAFVYGSTARGDERANSDIDLMVIGDVNPDELLEQVGKAEKSLMRELNYTIYPRKELTRNESGFIDEVLRDEKIMLVGDERELKRIAEERRGKKNPAG